MKKLKLILAAVGRFFFSARAQQQLSMVAEFVPRALPLLEVAASLVTGATPTKADDAVLAMLRADFPALFDGSVASGEELKLYMLGVAARLLEQKYPQLTTSIARAAVQLAYVGQKADRS